jgi:aminopeptidase N
MENLSNTPAVQQPPLIHRKDYKPYPWLIPQTRLEFELGLERTLIRSRLTVERNPAAEPSQTMRLNGDGLAARSVMVDGTLSDDWQMNGSDLVLSLSGDAHSLEIVTEIDPSQNTQLMGLYASGGMLCTQCEAEGFRRITFFPDRPDVLSVYTVRMSAPKDAFPVLLCNGNPAAQGEDAQAGTHWAEWHDPWPKPSYLFALVAGDLVAKSGDFLTMSGKQVACNIWVRQEDLGRTDHALRSLHNSMRWDEDVFGREYDLQVYNIVAVSDFNMGAMENKGLNVFNTKYVLADVETATDADFDAVEGVIAHEYFHNWSGNRVTCRDWFQLSLKEGFTVLRDQLFSQDMHSESVKRIEDVRILRSAQFPEDSGPLAHPIRPDSFREISNFYTATVYNKGAEVIRMMRSLCGVEAFRKGTDLYFERHDGEAATCEDFICAIEDGAGLDLEQFRLWYAQAGTPKVTARLQTAEGRAKLHLTQSVPDTPGQEDKSPMPIPLRVALHDQTSGNLGEEQLIVLNEAEASFDLGAHSDETPASPALSINRGFTAPVRIERQADTAQLAFLAAHDDDPFARYEAMQELLVGHLLACARGAAGGASDASERDIAEAFGRIIADETLDDLMRGELMALPGVTFLMDQLEAADPLALHNAREALKAQLGKQWQGELAAMHQRASAIAFAHDAPAKGARTVKTAALTFLAASDPQLAAQMAAQQYDTADNMTDRQGALMVLCGLETDARTAKLDDFYQRFSGNALVIDKWFSLQAMSLHPEAIAHVKALAQHPDFTLSNPNRARALYMAFAANPAAFHAASGEGYRMLADFLLALDPINAQTAARFVPALGRWRKMEPARAKLMRAELERIASADGLSRDTAEQVTRSLD